MNHLQSWPEPVVRVQSLSESGLSHIPDRYVKKPEDRPVLSGNEIKISLPVIDMEGLYSDDVTVRQNTAELTSRACQEWGFFHVVNHDVSHELMARMRDVWRDFFKLPLEEKQKYANSASDYEGYGSRLGVEKGISLDWCDYFFLNYLPVEIRDENKWPTLPPSCRELVKEYSKELVKVGGKLMKIFSSNLGLRDDGHLQQAFGGKEGIISACMRVNYYPKCPQPDLTLGLSPHSDPGGLTILYPDENISGLQVRHNGCWVNVDPISNAFIVNIGDQLQVLSNSKYQSVEHRVIVNSVKERVSMAFFYNPRGDVIIKPVEQLLTADHPPLYPAMKFDDYRRYIRIKGPSGKSQVESLIKSHQ